MQGAMIGAKRPTVLAPTSRRIPPFPHRVRPAYAQGVLGREKQHPWLGKPEHMRIATIGVYVFGGLMLALVLSAFVAAIIG